MHFHGAVTATARVFATGDVIAFFTANGNEQRQEQRVIRLRLRRMGAKKRPSYRIVAADQRSPRDGRFIETIGIYDPLTDPATVRINEERARHWLTVGAQPSDTVGDLLRKAGITRDAAADAAAAAAATEQPAEPAAV